MIPRILLIAALGVSSLSAADPTTEDLLRQGLFEEEANRDFDKASERYREVIAAHDRQRALAATATYRLGEIARKKNDKESAAKAFQLVAERYPEQTELARLSRENLVALGVNLPTPEKTDAPPALTTIDPEETEIARLKDIAKNSPDLLDGTDDEGWRPIHRAARNGWTKVIAYLLENKADPNSRTLRLGLTPLQVAATYGQLAAVNSLIAAKADIQAVTSDEDWNSGLFPQRENSANFFNGNWRALDLAILYNRKEIARTLLEAKADPALSGPQVGSGFGVGMADSFIPPGDGLTLPLYPLHMAILLKRDEIALELLKAGAPLTAAEGKKAPTALQCAVLHNPDMVEVLLKAKADPMQGFPAFQVSPLHEASNQGSIQIAKLLLDAGADAKAADAMGGTPLHVAGNAEMVDLLISKGADPNAKDKSGQVPLDALAMRVDPKAMEALLEYGATVADPVALLRRTNELTISFVRERIAYPKLQSEDAILLSFNRAARLDIDSRINGNFITILESKPAPGSPPPTLAEGLWPFLNPSQNHGGTRYLAKLRILRRKDGGGFATVFEWVPKANEAAPTAWPALEWGDIVEFDGSFGNQLGEMPLERHSFGKLPALKAMIRLESWNTYYSLTDPDSQENPVDEIWLKQQLANIPNELASLVDRTHISVIRKGLGKPIELDLSKQKHPGFRLIDGDVIDLKFSERFWSRLPDQSVSVLTAMLKLNYTEPESLIPILANHYEGIQTDWRHVRILQRGGDKPSRNVNVVEWMQSLPPREKWNKEEILAKDLKIQAGEVVLIPPLRDGDEAEKKTASETSDRIREVTKFLKQAEPGE